MKVVVTGGAGFIGANLCRAMVSRPEFDDIVVVDDISTGDARNLDHVGVQLLIGSILDRSLLDTAFAGASAVVHLAAIPSVPRSLANPRASHEANATGTLEVLEAARRAGDVHVLMASSSSVYGRNPELPKRESLRCEPMSPYAVSKLAAESYALAYAACFGLRVLPFRFFNVFGPLQPAGHAYAAVIPTFIDAALRGCPLPLDGDGTQTRDFTYVDSVTAVIMEALVGGVSHDGPVNLAFGSRRALLDVIAQIGEMLGRSLDIDHRPVRLGDVPHSQADSTTLRELFPTLEPVDFSRGLRRTVEWMQSQPGASTAFDAVAPSALTQN